MGKSKGWAYSSGLAASLLPESQGVVPVVGFGGYYGASRVEPAALLTSSSADPDGPVRLPPDVDGDLRRLGRKDPTTKGPSTGEQAPSTGSPAASDVKAVAGAGPTASTSPGASGNSYEKQRRRQMERNKRKLDELGLRKLYTAVLQAPSKPMPTKLDAPTRWKPRLDAPTRRSGRIASFPHQPNYCNRKAKGDVRTELPNEERAWAVTKAKQLKDQLGSDHPTFVSLLTHYYSTISHRLNLPVHVAQYLPANDEMVSLVDDQGNKFKMLYRVKYKPRMLCSLNRWRAFAACHKLVGGDCLVFQLIERTKFKVYIVRANKIDH